MPPGGEVGWVERLRAILGGGGGGGGATDGVGTNPFAGMDDDQLELLRQINLIATQFGVSGEAAAALLTAQAGGLLSESQAGELLLGGRDGGGAGGVGGSAAPLMNALENQRQGAYAREADRIRLQQAAQRIEDERRSSQAGLGSELFGSLLDAQIAANRRPISLVDQLLLSGEVGSTLALSQGGEEGRGRFTSAPRSNLLSDLQRRLELYTVGALNPTQQVSEGFNPSSGLPLAQGERAFIEAAARQRGIAPGTFADEPNRPANEPRKFAHGGSLRIDPNQAVSTRSSIAGPASLVDRTGQRVAVMGEANQPETLSVAAGGNVPGGGLPGTDAPVTTQLPETLDMLRPDERIRFDELMRVAPNVGVNEAIAIAQRPGDFEQFIGVHTDPRVAGSRLLGGAISGDQRFSPTLLRPLALGRAPGPEQLTLRDFASMPPDIQDALMSVVGPDLMTQFLFELGQFSPLGRAARIAGPIRQAA